MTMPYRLELDIDTYNTAQGESKNYSYQVFGVIVGELIFQN